MNTCKAQPSENIARISDYLDWNAKHGFSGNIMIVSQGQVLLSKAYGLANKAHNVANTPQTAISIGSITKQFTAAGIMKLAEMKKLTTSDPLSKFFKDVPEDKANITIHQLLTHTSGFVSQLGPDYKPTTKEELVKNAFASQLLCQPGTKYNYSNMGYSILGIIIENLSGVGYEKFLHDNLFDPAGMEHTGYLIPKFEPQDVATGYFLGDSQPSVYEDIMDGQPYWNLFGNGGIMSTPGDMIRWHVALLMNTVLSEESVKKMTTEYVKESEDDDPRAGYYGYGWVIMKTPRNTKLVTHNGGNKFFFADFLRFVDERAAIYLAANQSNGYTQQMAHNIGKMLFDKNFTPEMTEEGASMIKSLKTFTNDKQGKVAEEFFSLISHFDETKAEDFVKANFTPAFANSAPMDQLVGQIKKLSNQLPSPTIASMELVAGFRYVLHLISGNTKIKLMMGFVDGDQIAGYRFMQE